MDNLQEFLALANIVTSVGIRAVISLAETLKNTDPDPLLLANSIVPVDARHDSFSRVSNSQFSNLTPYNTGITQLWAYNLAQLVAVLIINIELRKEH